MTITLNASKGTGDITDYYVAFYNKTLTQAATASTFLADVKAKFKSTDGIAAKNGFLLRYNTTLAKYYVWDYSATTSTIGASGCDTNGCWFEMNTEGWRICGKTSGVKDCDAKLYYTAYAVSTTPSWKILLDKNFGSKIMYTASYVVDSNNLSVFDANKNPTY